MIITKRKRYILHLLSAFIGFVYLVSGFAKATNIKEFYYSITNFGIHSLNFLAPLIVVFEIALSVSLIFQIRLKMSAIISSVTIIVFSLIFIYGYVFYSIDDCGCLGSLGIEISPMWFFILNTLVFSISIAIFSLYPEEAKIEPYKKYIFFFTVLITTYIVGFTYNNPIKVKTEKKNILEYEKRNINNLQIGKYAPKSNNSTYMLYFFSYSCPHCLNSFENIKQYTKSGFVDNIVLIGTGDKESLDSYNFEIGYQHFDISEKEMTDAIKTLPVPVSFFIVNDTIRKIWQGTLPVHQNLRKKRFLDY